MGEPSVGDVFETTFRKVALQAQGTIESLPWLAKVSDDAAMTSLETIWGCLETLGFRPPRPLEGRHLASWPAELVMLGFPGFGAEGKSLCEAEQYFRGLISLDGDYRIAGMPPQGEVSTDSRVLHLRMKHFGLFPYPVDDPFGDSEGPWEYALRFWLGLNVGVTSLELANLLGDMDSLWALVIRALADRPFLIVRGRVDTEWPIEAPEMVRAAWEGRPWNPRAQEHCETPESLSEEARNRFAERVLQMLLWMDGHYEGHPSDYPSEGDVSRLIEAVRYRRNLTTAGITRDAAFILRRVGQDLWAVNLEAVKTLFVDLPPAMALGNGRLPEESAPMLAELLTLPPCDFDEPVFNDRMSRALYAPRPIAPEPDNPVTGFFHNAYEGAKRLLKNASHAVQQGLSWVHDHVLRPTGAFLARISRSVVQGWRYFTDVVVPAVRNFFHGIFLDQGPGKDGAFVLTHLSLDCDTMVIVDQPVEGGLLRNHSDRMKTFVAALRTVMDILGRSAALIIKLAAGPIGWARVVLQVGDMVLQVLRARVLNPAQATEL